MNDLRRVVMLAAVTALCMLAGRALLSGPARPGLSTGSVPSSQRAVRDIAPSAGFFDEVDGAAVFGLGTEVASDRPGRARSARLAIEDAELVLGPRSAGFDTTAVVARHGGALAQHTEAFDGARMSGAQIIDVVAMDHSVSPAVILTFLELASGALTEPGPLAAPLGSTRAAARGEGLHAAAGRIAAWLNDAYYAERHRGGRLLGASGARSVLSTRHPNAAQTAVAHGISTLWPERDPEERMSAFAATYSQIFGELAAEPSMPPIPEGLEQPPLLLPWQEGEAWHFTGGPHGSWGSGSAWGAIDFAPPTPVGCSPSPEWVIASAPGVVVSSRQGQVLVDLDGDGLVHTGWVVLYQHMSGGERVAVGERVQAGDRIGHPSCEGGFATGSHVHFARRYDGEWLPAAGGPVPLSLSGWTFTSGQTEYDGEMSHGSEGERVALKRRNGRVTSVVSDNGSAKRAEHAAQWAALQAGGAHLVAAAEPAASAPPDLTSPLNPTSPLAALPAAVLALDSDVPRLIIRLLLQGRRQHDTAFVVALERSGEPTIGLHGRTDEDGLSMPLALPYGVGGEYDVVLRIPGFTPARVIAAAIELDVVEIDFSGGGMTPLRAGDLNGDGSIDAADVLAWFTARRRGWGSADLDGDGKAGARDFVRLVLPAFRDG